MAVVSASGGLSIGFIWYWHPQIIGKGCLRLEPEVGNDERGRLTFGERQCIKRLKPPRFGGAQAGRFGAAIEFGVVRGNKKSRTQEAEEFFAGHVRQVGGGSGLQLRRHRTRRRRRKVCLRSVRLQASDRRRGGLLRPQRRYQALRLETHRYAAAVLDSGTSAGVDTIAFDTQCIASEGLGRARDQPGIAGVSRGQRGNDLPSALAAAPLMQVDHRRAAAEKGIEHDLTAGRAVADWHRRPSPRALAQIPQLIALCQQHRGPVSCKQPSPRPACP